MKFNFLPLFMRGNILVKTKAGGMFIMVGQFIRIPKLTLTGDYGATKLAFAPQNKPII